MYNMMLKNDDLRLKRLKGVDGKILHDFPATRQAFWCLPSSKVVGLLNDLKVDYSHCENDEDRLQELGMQIGVHPKRAFPTGTNFPPQSQHLPCKYSFAYSCISFLCTRTHEIN